MDLKCVSVYIASNIQSSFMRRTIISMILNYVQLNVASVGIYLWNVQNVYFIVYTTPNVYNLIIL